MICDYIVNKDKMVEKGRIGLLVDKGTNAVQERPKMFFMILLVL